jgi:hypothetical protein
MRTQIASAFPQYKWQKQTDIKLPKCDELWEGIRQHVHLCLVSQPIWHPLLLSKLPTQHSEDCVVLPQGAMDLRHGYADNACPSILAPFEPCNR